MGDQSLTADSRLCQPELSLVKGEVEDNAVRGLSPTGCGNRRMGYSEGRPSVERATGACGPAVAGLP